MRAIIEYFNGLGVDPNTSVTIVVSILTFSIGFVITWIAKEIAAFRERTSYSESMMLILRDFVKACELQHKAITRSLAKTGLIDGNDFMIRYAPIGTLDYLSRLDFNVFLKNTSPIFFKKKFSKAISKLFQLIAQIKDINERSASTLSQFMS